MQLVVSLQFCGQLEQEHRMVVIGKDCIYPQGERKQNDFESPRGPVTFIWMSIMDAKNGCILPPRIWNFDFVR